MRNLLKAIAALAIVSTVVLMQPTPASAKALTPLLVSGPDCPAGSARSAPWLLFEDLNGDGTYDFITAGDCNGQVRGRPWNTSVHADPWNPAAGDIIIGSLPSGVANLVPTLTPRERPSGIYTWEIIEHVSGTSPEICHIRRDAGQILRMSCPPQNGDDLH